jgi:hypothetical protein
MGGIYNSAVSIDNTKTYRMSWWERRVINATAGYHYAGLNGYGSVNGVIQVYSGSQGVTTTNPYFTNWLYNNILSTNGKWHLVVGHLHSHDYTGFMRSDSGIYFDGIKKSVISADYKSLPQTTSARPRTLVMYYANTLGATHYSLYPRMDLLDGTEPSVQDLLNGYDVTNNTYINELGIPLTPNSINIGKLDITQNLYANFDIYKVAVYDNILTDIDIARIFNYEKRFFDIKKPIIKFNQIEIERPYNNIRLKLKHIKIF